MPQPEVENASVGDPYQRKVNAAGMDEAGGAAICGPGHIEGIVSGEPQCPVIDGEGRMDLSWSADDVDIRLMGKFLDRLRDRFRCLFGR